ncbi:unnamed protein product [Victoria cruziana]
MAPFPKRFSIRLRFPLPPVVISDFTLHPPPVLALFCCLDDILLRWRMSEPMICRRAPDFFPARMLKFFLIQPMYLYSTVTGKKLVFVTNNSTKSRRQYAKKFERVGLIVNEEEIFSSSFAASVFLESINFPKQKKVYVIGEEGISEELQLIGLTCLGGTEDGKKRIELKPNLFIEHDKSVGAVVVGLDQYINYYKIHYATLCIRENPGCLFIATNQDASGHMTDMQEWPGAGAMVGAIRGATQKEPIVVGKPSQLMMKLLLQRFQTDASKMCMVGDRLDTDILFGLDGGCKTLLVLSGVTTLAGLNDPSNKIHPDYYTEKVSNLMELV